jgi:hypothetical protein
MFFSSQYIEGLSNTYNIVHQPNPYSRNNHLLSIFLAFLELQKSLGKETGHKMSRPDLAEVRTGLGARSFRDRAAGAETAA